MSKKPEHLCDWKAEHLKDLDTYRELVLDPRYVCRKCGRVAHKKKWLCKPVSLLKE